MKKDGRAVARENELRVLRALHRFGWLRTRDIAVLVWQRWSAKPGNNLLDLQPLMPTESGLRMAQRTLQRMRERRLTLSSRAPDGSTIYALSEAGARSLRTIGMVAASGKDLMRQFSSSHYRHRCIANEIAVAAIVDGFSASTEREIAQGRWLGKDAGIAGKRPDVLVRFKKLIWWVEVERSRKNAKDYLRLLQWLGAAGTDAFNPSGNQLLGENLCWEKIVFICTPAFKSKLLRDLESAGWKETQIEKLLTFSTSLYSLQDIIFS